MIKRLAKLSPFVIALLAVIVLGGVASSAALYRVTNSGQSVSVNEHGVCKKVMNNNGSDIFVPTNTSNEWGLFRSNATNVALSDCTASMIVSAGMLYAGACAVSNGEVKCWGSTPTPTDVSGLSSGVTDLSVGFASACAIQNGAAKCWGLKSTGNQYGQLGDGTTVNSLTPVSVTGLSSGVTSISVSNNGACAVHNSAVKCWGANASGQLGNGTTVSSLVPVSVAGLSSGASIVSTGGNVTCAVQSGAAKCWGSNAYGSLGNGTTTDSLVPVSVTGLSSGVSDIYAGPAGGGGTFVCAIHNGAAKCWGRNGDNQNVGTTNSSLTPVSITGLTSGVTDISINIYATCAVQSEALKCWGSNVWSQLADPAIAGVSTTSLTRFTPVSAPTLTSGVENVSMGPFAACATHNGVAKCWGEINSTNTPAVVWAP
jgi:Regulator of chromosome condensation (RCC1) repeat